MQCYLGILIYLWITGAKSGKYTLTAFCLSIRQLLPFALAILQLLPFASVIQLNLRTRLVYTAFAQSLSGAKFQVGVSLYDENMNEEAKFTKLSSGRLLLDMSRNGKIILPCFIMLESLKMSRSISYSCGIHN